MAGNFQSSFIPKDPVVSEDVFKKKKAGPAGILVVSLFIFSIIVAGAMYFYKGILKNEIESAQSDLAAAEKNIDKEAIRELSKFSQKLDIVRAIVLKHQVISGFLDSLASSTVSTVQITRFEFGALSQNELSVTMTGLTTGFAGVALQENEFVNTKFWKNVNFSELTLTEKGKVSFKANVAIDPQIVQYKVEPVPEDASAKKPPEAGAKAELEDLESLDAEINNL